MDWIDYREKLGIGFNDEEIATYFYNRIFNVLSSIKHDYPMLLDADEYFNFCEMTGTTMKYDTYYDHYYGFVLEVLGKHKKNFTDFISFYVAFVNSQKDNSYKRFDKNIFKNLLCKTLEESHIPYEIIEDESRWFLFPKGAKELDDALVSETFCWMKDYPMTQKAWITALKDYSESTELTASETADNFRKALERFFQEFFESEKSLENLKSEYGKYLSSKGVSNEIKNNFQTLLQSYTNYINDYAKHHDKVSKNVLEYIMYQTGNIIRLLITLSKED